MFTLEKVLENLPMLIRPIVSEFLSSNSLVIGRTYNTGNTVSFCGITWSITPIVLAFEPRVVLVVFQAQKGILPAHVCHSFALSMATELTLGEAEPVLTREFIRRYENLFNGT
jgi:hypothetical protein